MKTGSEATEQRPDTEELIEYADMLCRDERGDLDQQRVEVVTQALIDFLIRAGKLERHLRVVHR